MKTIAILGIGKLGLCFALNLERVGYRVIGVDIDKEYVAQINEKTFFSHEPLVNEYLAKSENFIATTDIDQVINSRARLIFVVVATPSTPEGGYNHYQIERIAEELMQRGVRVKRVNNSKNQQSMQRHLVVMCTTMPGYTDTLAERMKPYLYTVSYNPEFIAQGSIIHNQVYPDQVLIGEHSSEVGEMIKEIYKRMCRSTPVYCQMTRLSAEICKLATNCFLTTKISFANAIGDLAKQVGAEPEKILEAIGTDSRIGNKYLKYGFGFGGPCFPRDNRALNMYAVTQNYPLLISQATDEVNKNHLSFQTQQWLENYPPDQPIVFDYVSYKQGSILIEESQQLALAVNLAQHGRKVVIHDTPAVVEQVKAIYGDLFIYE